MGLSKNISLGLPLLSVIFLVVGFALWYAKVTGIQLRSHTALKVKEVVLQRLRKDEKNTRRRNQLELIGVSSTGLYKSYRSLVSNIIVSLRLTGTTVENFTTLFILFGILSGVAMTFVFSSVVVGLFISLPCVVALIAVLVSLTKSKVRANDNNVMDSTDLICPTIEHDVTSSIRGALDGIHPKTRKHYEEFLNNIDARGMLFEEAMVDLSKKLGPRFDEFARNALIFYESGDEGMHEMFRDIMDMNNSTRSINARADAVFERVNTNMLMCSGLIGAFLGFTYVSEMTRDIMLYSFIGKMVTAISLSVILIMYSLGQISQMTIDYDAVKGD